LSADRTILGALDARPVYDALIKANPDRYRIGLAFAGLRTPDVEAHQMLSRVRGEG